MTEPIPTSHAAHRAARRLALAAIFEADFGQRTPASALERQLSDIGADAETAAYARQLVEAVVRHRDSIDARIEQVAPAYPVVQLARIDRALLRSGLGELLHSAATPARVVIAEWVGLARAYSGEPARRLLNGVLGRIADEAGLAAPTRGGGDRESGRSRSGGVRPPR
ncbi:MAG: transcription antitermination factor NusB [Chloroflexi bacterium]|nr:transcription antitermination factor NusB [Chloroflexota bacterium]